MTDDELIIVGDEAYTPEEWAKRLRKRERDRAYRSRKAVDPAWRARERAYQRKWRAAHPTYKRDWMRVNRPNRRQVKALAIASARISLHELSCPYPAKGCGCRVVLIA